MPSQKERKRKDPAHLKRVIKNAEKEIGVLEVKLSSQKISASEVGKVENRICILMNSTIPNAVSSLGEKKIFL